MADICDFDTITGKYIYFKVWMHAIEDVLGLVSILISATMFVFLQIQKYNNNKRD